MIGDENGAPVLGAEVERSGALEATGDGILPDAQAGSSEARDEPRGRDLLERLAREAEFDPDWVRTLAGKLSGHSGQADVVVRMLAQLMPAEASAGEWIEWAKQCLDGAVFPPEKDLVRPYPRSSRLSREVHRSVTRIADLGARRLKAQVAVQELDAEIEKERADLRQALLWSVLVAMRRHVAPVFAMGPAWWLMAALQGDTALLQKVDALGADPAFRDGLREALEAYVEDHEKGIKRAPRVRRPQRVRDELPYSGMELAERVESDILKPAGKALPAAGETGPETAGEALPEAADGLIGEATFSIDMIDAVVEPKAPDEDDKKPDGSETVANFGF